MKPTTIRASHYAQQPGKWASACLSLIALALCSIPASARELRIEHVTVISPESPKPLRDVFVLIRDDRIVSISQRAPRASQAAEVIDGRGLYLTPGLIDSHVHTGLVHGMLPEHEQAHPDITRAARQQTPRSYLYFGFTTLIDLNSEADLVARWNTEELHPDLHFCGGAPVVDGYPTVWVPKPERYQLRYLLVQPGDAAPEGVDLAAHTPEAVIARMKADGAQCVKTFYENEVAGGSDWSTPRLDTMRALVAAAHAAHMPVLMHASSTEAQAFALEAGVDVIAHGLWTWSGEQGAAEITPRVRQVLDGVLKQKTGWQPTMQVGPGFRDLFDPQYLSDPRLARVLPAALIDWYRTPEGQWFRNQRARDMLPPSLAQSGSADEIWAVIRSIYDRTPSPLAQTVNYLATHDARLLFGTDTPSSPLYSNRPGLNGRIEMDRLLDAGMTPAQIFRAATLANAEAMGLDREIGTVQAGKRANLLLLRADPTQSISAYDHIVKVIVRGQSLDRASLAANGGETRG